MSKEKKKTHYKLAELEPTIVEEPFIKYETLNLDSTKSYTYADYLTWFDNKRRELINGFIHFMSAPSEIHARLSHVLSWFIELFVRQRQGKCRIYQAPFDVRFPKNNETDDKKIYNVVQPDICQLV